MKFDCAILCGGYGSRLKNLTKYTPKPLLKIVKDRPFLYFLIKHLIENKINKIVLLTYYKSSKFKTFKKKFFPKNSIKIYEEKKKLGTGGAILNIKKKMNNFFFLINGDTFYDVNFYNLKKNNFKANNLTIPCVFKKKTNYSFFTNNKKKISKVVFKKHPEGLVSSGIYMFQRDLLDNFNTTECDLDKDIVRSLISQKKVNFQLLDRKKIIDIGQNQKTFFNSKKKILKLIKRPCCFLDRDGVINYDYGYVNKIRDFKWKPGIKKFIKSLKDLNFYVIVITNQAGVAHGYFDEHQINKLHHYINFELLKYGTFINSFYYCPYHPEAAKKKYKKKTNLRKPGNGMLLKAFKDFNINKRKSFFVGDKDTDRKCAKKSNIKYFDGSKNILKILDKI